jgi:hypothetical protein
MGQPSARRCATGRGADREGQSPPRRPPRSRAGDRSLVAGFERSRGWRRAGGACGGERAERARRAVERPRLTSITIGDRPDADAIPSVRRSLAGPPLPSNVEVSVDQRPAGTPAAASRHTAATGAGMAVEAAPTGVIAALSRAGGGSSNLSAKTRGGPAPARCCTGATADARAAACQCRRRAAQAHPPPASAGVGGQPAPPPVDPAAARSQRHRSAAAATAGRPPRRRGPAADKSRERAARSDIPTRRVDRASIQRALSQDARSVRRRPSSETGAGRCVGSLWSRCCCCCSRSRSTL